MDRTQQEQRALACVFLFHYVYKFVYEFVPLLLSIFIFVCVSIFISLTASVFVVQSAERMDETHQEQFAKQRASETG